MQRNVSTAKENIGNYFLFHRVLDMACNLSYKHYNVCSGNCDIILLINSTSYSHTFLQSTFGKGRRIRQTIQLFMNCSTHVLSSGCLLLYYLSKRNNVKSGVKAGSEKELVRELSCDQKWTRRDQAC